MKKIVEERKEFFIEKFRNDYLNSLLKLASDVKETAVWHGISTYGMRKGDEWIPAVDACTGDIAKWIIEKAKNAFKICNEFYEKIT